MVDAFWKFLLDNYPQVAYVGLLVFVVAYVTVKIHTFYIRTSRFAMRIRK